MAVENARLIQWEDLHLYRTIRLTQFYLLFSVAEMQIARIHEGLSFTKGTRLMQISAIEDHSGDISLKHSQGTVLYDLLNDPNQVSPIHDL